MFTVSCPVHPCESLIVPINSPVLVTFISSEKIPLFQYITSKLFKSLMNILSPSQIDLSIPKSIIGLGLNTALIVTESIQPLLFVIETVYSSDSDIVIDCVVALLGFHK